MLPRRRPVAPSSSERGELRANLQRSRLDGVFFCVMVGCGETYVPAFALALGLPDVLAGLVASLPMLAGAVLQLATPRGVLWVGSLRRWSVLCAGLQACAFLPLVAAALLGAMPAWLLFLVAAWYWCAGLAGAPAWNTWIAALVPPSVRPNYFAHRTRLLQVAQLGSVLAAGGVLQLGGERGHVLGAFALLFAVAGIARLVSTRYLSLQTEAARLPEGFRRIPLREVAEKLRRKSYGHLIAYMFVLQAAVQVASPFFTPFMLEELHMEYGTYMTMVATAVLGKVLTLPLYGELARRRGARRLIWIGGLGIVPVGLPWMITDSLPVLLAAQFAAGSAWAAYELATFLLFFDHIPEPERTSVLTTYNLTNALAFAAGSLAGGALLGALGADRSAYLWVFAASTGLRALTPLLLKQVGLPEAPSTAGAPSAAARPALGSADRPILMEEPDAAADRVRP